MGINQLKKKIAIDLARRTRERVIHRFIYKLHLYFFYQTPFCYARLTNTRNRPRLSCFFPSPQKIFLGSGRAQQGGQESGACFKKSSRKLQESYKKATRKLQESFKKASRKLQESFLEVFLKLS